MKIKTPPNIKTEVKTTPNFKTEFIMLLQHCYNIIWGYCTIAQELISSHVVSWGLPIQSTKTSWIINGASTQNCWEARLLTWILFLQMAVLKIPLNLSCLWHLSVSHFLPLSLALPLSPVSVHVTNVFGTRWTVCSALNSDGGLYGAMDLPSPSH